MYAYVSLSVCVCVCVRVVSTQCSQLCSLHDSATHVLCDVMKVT